MRRQNAAGTGEAEEGHGHGRGLIVVGGGLQIGDAAGRERRAEGHAKGRDLVLRGVVFADALPLRLQALQQAHSLEEVEGLWSGKECSAAGAWSESGACAVFSLRTVGGRVVGAMLMVVTFLPRKAR